MKKIILIILLWLIPSVAYPGPCWVVKVHDGDTFTIATTLGQVNIRIACIDAPELNQPYGEQARDYLKKLILYKFVEIKPVGISYGRVVCIVYIGDKLVAEEMVHNGYAWVDERYCRDPYLLTLMENAKKRKIGLWKGNPIPPWKWRKR